MSILETFYIMFKSDSSDVKKGAEEAKRSTDKLNESLNNTANAGKKIGDSFLSMGRALTGVLASAVSIGSIISGVKSANEYATEIDRASRALGVNVEELDVWGAAVQRTGGTLGGFEGSLRGLSNHLGITSKQALQILPQLADQFHNVSQYTAIRYGKMLGLDEPTILLLQKGRRELDELIKRQKELGAVSKEDAENARKFDFAMQDLSRAFRSVFLAVGETIIPILTKFIDVLTPVALYFRKHSDFIVGALYAIGAAAGVAAFSLGLVSLPAIATAAAIGLVIGAIALVYDDLQTFIKGGDSLIGRAAERWPRAFKAIADAIKWVRNLLGAVNEGEQQKNVFTKIIKNANEFPLNPVSSGSIINSGGARTKTSSVVTGDIVINTSQDSPRGFASAIVRELNTQIAQTNNMNDDGIFA